MHLINHLPHVHQEDLEGRHAILLKTDRLTLAKRRWRGAAENGQEFGFNLEHGLRHGAIVHLSNGDYYVLDQRPEPVLEIPYHSAEEGAKIGWQIGNLHFPCEVVAGGGTLRVIDDVALRQMLEREKIPHTHTHAVFQPLKAVAGGHSHGHSHGHEPEPDSHSHAHPHDHSHHADDHSHGDHLNHA